MNTPFILALLAFCIAAIGCVVLILRYMKLSRSVDTVEFKLSRHHKNPVISPLPIKEWELGGTFNPAAVMDDEGKIHLLYRAVGADGVSRIGHAASDDGLHFENRSQYPVFEPTPGYGMAEASAVSGPTEYNPNFYTSGGGWSGSEDPRTVKIGNKVYMTYVAFEGWDSVRIALTSIGMNDLKYRKWRWRKPALISAPGQVAKNWVIFPEKIKGKYAILHAITPNILVDYVDSLDALGNGIHLHSKPPKGGRNGFWDNWVRGAGPPPIKTNIGWLLIYHAMDRNDPNKYKLGAMILDMNDPTKVLYRSPQPILEPDAHYENDGKPGVVYASGAVVLKDNLMIYYGGGDKHVCIAQTPLQALLDWMQKYGKVK